MFNNPEGQNINFWKTQNRKPHIIVLTQKFNYHTNLMMMMMMMMMIIIIIIIIIIIMKIVVGDIPMLSNEHFL